MRDDAGNRYEALDGLRGIAALCVMSDHFSEVLHIPWWPPNLFLAVDIFFIMSGFVIAHSYTRRLQDGMSAWTYLARRILRLYPLFVAGLLIGVGALILGVRTGAIEYRTHDILVSALLNAVYLPFLNNAHIDTITGSVFPADPPAWSLLLEMLASLFFLVLFGLRRNALLAITALCLLLTVGAGLVFGHVAGQASLRLNNGWSTANILGGLPRVGYGFTLGVLLHRLADLPWVRRRAAAMARVPFASLALYAVLLAVLLFPKYAGGAVPLAVLTVVAPAIVLVSVAVQPRPGAEMHLARFLGWISYPVYCLHYPIVRLVHFSFIAGYGIFGSVGSGIFGSVGPGIFGILLFSTVATLVVSAFLTRFYDEPVRAALSRRLSSRLARRRAGPVEPIGP